MQDDFLAAIRAAPDDDLPRLIFADYLEERGNPRGEFIRAQITRLRTDDDDLRDRLRAREDKLLCRFEDEWIGYLGDTLYRWWFHRGFLEISLNVAKFLEDSELLQLPAAVGIHLHPPQYMDVSLVKELLHSRLTERVRSLYLGFEWVQDEVALELAQSDDLPNLIALDLANNGLTDSGVRAVANCFPGLQILALRNNLISDDGARALANAPNRAGLRQLDLSNNEITKEGLAALKKSPFLRGVEMELDGNRTRRKRSSASGAA